MSSYKNDIEELVPGVEIQTQYYTYFKKCEYPDCTVWLFYHDSGSEDARACFSVTVPGCVCSDDAVEEEEEFLLCSRHKEDYKILICECQKD